MPTALTIGACRFFFYASDRDEPPHAHAEREDRVAKFWLDPVRLQRSGGFQWVEPHGIQRLVEKHGVDLLRSWHEYFEV